MMLRYFYYLTISLCTLQSYFSYGQEPSSEVKIVGQMKNVMRKGQLYGTIHLDTIANKKNLYGFGPVEYLAGEILVIDGKSYKSTVISDTQMQVDETYDTKAPFFAYANIAKWKEQKLPESVQTIADLEQYLSSIASDSERPFLFKLDGKIEEAVIHIVNLPKGSKVSSPQEAHRGMVNYQLKDKEVEIVGFFSTQHQAIFTHHDTFLHLHLITKDKQWMGHLDEILLKKGSITLYLPID